MDIKKIGKWGGAFVGSFLVLLVLMYFLFPYLNPDKAAAVKNDASQAQQSNFDPAKYNLQAVDSLNQQISMLQGQVDSLRNSVTIKQQVIDSLKLELQTVSEGQSTPAISGNLVADVPAIEEAAKPLLSLDEDALAPIIDLLEEHQLINLYREGSGRQREKLLRTLKPEKAARILKKVM